MATPLTPFEVSGRTAWTTITEEATWLNAVLATSDRWTATTIGTSVDGTPIRMLSIGTGPRQMLWTSLIHPNEPASREVMLTTIREWEDSEDADLLDYLTRATVSLVPTANPDRFPDLRVNRNNVNINRDFLALSQPETLALQGAIHDLSPDVVVDWHEFHMAAPDYMLSAAVHPSADADLRAVSQQIVDTVASSIGAKGWSWFGYPIEYGPDWQLNSALLQGHISVLMETSTTLTMAQRHDMHLVSAGAIWRWHDANMDAAHATVQSSTGRMAARRSSLVLPLGESKSGPVIKPVPSHYLVTDTQWEALSVHRGTFGIVGTVDGDNVRIPMNQASQVLIAYLVDPASPQAIVTGEAVLASSPSFRHLRPIGYKYCVDGIPYDAEIRFKSET